MKKVLSFLLVCVLLVSFVSCGNISESYAKKINKAAEEGEAYTKAEVLEDLGDEAFEVNLLVGGVIIAVKGCESMEDVQAKIDDGKTVKGLIVTIVLGKATSAVYKEITEDDLK